MCPSRTHLVGECKKYEEERDVLEEETREIHQCDMEEVGLDSSEKTIAILRDIDLGFCGELYSVPHVSIAYVRGPPFLCLV